VRCARCGNENPGTNRFCGMCGATLIPEPAPAPAQSTPARFPAGSTPVQSPARSEPAVAPADSAAAEESSYISGPSFLGLGEPPASPKRRGNLSIDPRAASGSRNLDYLLEDDEEPTSGGVGKFVLIAVVVALALAVGLGYLRWKGPSLSGSKTSDKPAIAGQDSPPDSSSTAQPPPSTAAAPSPDVQPAAPPSSSGTVPDTTSGSEPAPTPERKLGDGAPAKATDAGSSKEPPSVAPHSSPKASARTEPIRPVPEPRPARAVTKPADPVTEAQKYIYGRGVQQDCDRGMRLLKPSAEQANPKAMIEMGALYSAGLCAPRDLPTSYRWFARALRKQPDNLSIQTDLQKLWGEMTQPERQLAIKLSQ
jgi:hypothetical protein